MNFTKVVLGGILALGLSASTGWAGEGCKWSKKDGKASKDGWSCDYKSKASHGKSAKGEACAKFKTAAAGEGCPLEACPKAGCWLDVVKTAAKDVKAAVSGSTGKIAAKKLAKVLASLKEKTPRVAALGVADAQGEATWIQTSKWAYKKAEWKTVGEFDGIHVMIRKSDGKTLAFLVPVSEKESSDQIFVAVNTGSENTES